MQKQHNKAIQQMMVLVSLEKKRVQSVYSGLAQILIIV